MKAGRRGAACNSSFGILRCYGNPVGTDASLQCSKWCREVDGNDNARLRKVEVKDGIDHNAIDRFLKLYLVLYSE